ncbi:MAG: S8 family serine peptidase [Alphaproteobacteria bacterium]|nr:S8 family serine peptidase [Alphaproteobacteria bacterium]
MLITMLLAGCSTDPGAEIASPDALAIGGTIQDHALNDVLIGKGVNGVCPYGGAGWTVSHLFPAGAPGVLADFCVARWTGQDAPSGGPSGFVPDQVAVAPMSIDDEDVELSSERRTQAVDVMPSLGNNPKARLAILDTIPDGQLDQSYFGSTPEFSNHGARVALLARRLVCGSNPTGTCAADLVSYLTLGFQVQNGEAVRNTSSGGAIGSISDVAVRLYEAVDDWENASNVGPLVVNLSAGWHPTYGGTEQTSEFDPLVDAVYQSIRHAACKDALLLAATGNIGGLQGDTPMPLLPAAWEGLDAPSASECVSDFEMSTQEAHNQAAVYHPLVYAVGGVQGDADLTPMAMNRPGARPPHLAAGSHLAVLNPATNAMMDMITGTSAATAVVSASAATVRAYRPDLDASEVMSILRQGAVGRGWTLGEEPEVCNGSSNVCDDSYVIGVCTSLRKACENNACNVTVNGTNCVTSAPLVELTDTAPSVTHVIDASDPGSCSNAVVDDGSTLPANEDSDCPILDLDGALARPMTLPMPPSSPCEPHCDLYLQTPINLVVPTWSTSFSNASVIGVFQDGTHVTVSLGALVANGYNIQENAGALLNGSNPLVGAALTYTISGTSTSAAEEILIIRP